MKRKIIVAGAGHGGVSAAILLSRKGFDVTVFEKQEEADLGYDWPDSMIPEAFDNIGIDRPPAESFTKSREVYYLSPQKTVMIKPHRKREKPSAYIDRKIVIHRLVDAAAASGVRFRFGETVLGAICSSGRVTGIVAQSGVYECDLVIDAAGTDSPVRQSLPASFGILNHIDDSDTLYTYRALYAHNGDISYLPDNCASFYHCGERGYDWVINERDYVDILVGRIGEIDDETVETALDDFRSDHSYIGDTVLRGGQFAKIPLRKTLSKFIGSGYAAIGDSASMIEPLSGSGITLSMNSAILLADAVEAAAEDDYDEKHLWTYEYSFFKKYIKMILHDDALKCLLMDVGADGVNTMFEKGVLCAKDMYGGKLNPNELLKKASGVFTTPSLIAPLVKAANRLSGIDELCKTLPEEYDPAAVSQWIEKYDRQ